MTDHPVLTVLSGLAAVMFVTAFSAAAVVRTDSPAPSQAGARTAPATASELSRTAAAPRSSMSAVASVPQLRLPVQRKPKHVAPAPAAPVRVAAAAPVPTAAPAPVVAAPAPVTAHPAPARPAAPYVGKPFDSSG